MGTVENGLIEQLVEREVAKRLHGLQAQMAVQHWLLTELVRYAPRQALLGASRRLDQMCQQAAEPERAGLQAQWASWRLYLCQRAGLVEGDTPPAPDPAQAAPPRLPTLAD